MFNRMSYNKIDMKSSVLFLLASLLILNVGCNVSSSSTNNVQVVKDSISEANINEIHNGELDSVASELPSVILTRLIQDLKNRIENKDRELPFDSDKSYKINKQTLLIADKGWYAFLIEGQLLPSEAEFNMYGAYKNKDSISFNFFSQPVEIVTKLTNYSSTNNSIQLYGFQWDLSGIDSGEKPPKNKEILISYPQ